MKGLGGELVLAGASTSGISQTYIPFFRAPSKGPQRPQVHPSLVSGGSKEDTAEVDPESVDLSWERDWF